jgi:hypothetical protein
MDNDFVEIIRAANREFQQFIDQVTESGAQVVESAGASRRLEKVDARLKQVSEHLASAVKESAQNPEAAYDLLKYRENLRTLRSVMETLNFSLLAQKARLENVRANMQSACAWATSLREIS